MFGLFGGKDKGFDLARRALEQNRELYGNIDMPEYKEVVPELYDNETANHELVNEDPALRSKQLEALAKFSDLSESGLSEMDEAGFAQARALGDQQAKSGTDAAINDAAVRGVGGGGQEFAMREMANQAGASRANEAAMAQAAAKAQQRQQYLNAYANQVGGARDQDYRANAANTDVINRFNMANTNQRNQTGMANVDQRNDAFKYNEGLKDKNYQNKLGRADRIAGINTDGAKIGSAEEEARRRRNSAIGGAIGAGAGAAFGGPAGAVAGGTIGSALF